MRFSRWCQTFRAFLPLYLNGTKNGRLTYVRVTASAAATVPFSYHGVDMSNPDVVARVSRELADLDASAAEFDYELKGYTRPLHV